MIYSQAELEQKSQKWLDFRLGGVGASEMPAIMGDLPPMWKSPYDIFLSKMGKPQPPMTEDMQRGVHYEDTARKYVENYFNKCQIDKNQAICRNVLDTYQENCNFPVDFKQLTAQYADFSPIFASFDGVDVKNRVILELKCPKEANFKKFLKKQEITKTYRAQIQTQLMIANSHWGIKTGIFAQFFNEGVYLEDKKTGITKLIRLILIKAEYDEEYCKKLEDTARKFWSMVENRQWRKDWNN